MSMYQNLHSILISVEVPFVKYTHGKKLGNTSCVTRVNFGLFVLQSNYKLTKVFNLSKSVVSKLASA